MKGSGAGIQRRVGSSWMQLGLIPHVAGTDLCGRGTTIKLGGLWAAVGVATHPHCLSYPQVNMVIGILVFNKLVSKDGITDKKLKERAG